MSTHKHFDKICCVVLALTLILTVLFVNGEKIGIQKASSVPGYEKNLFDNSKVHTIDIITDDWDEFTANARSEEYYTCSVVIDGEAFKNVAIRGKGNTSLSSVTNGRYSYKIEFDHYDGTNNYYGLDKLCLNNVIQDNTYMKDYLTYTMMNDMGVAAPLCSFAYITVNGEDWGLYLAVEGVEESFLQRNYGKNYGELYKPDSMNMGGGRGNGDKFDMDEFMQDFDNDSAEKTTQTDVSATQPSADQTTQPANETTAEAPASHDMPEDMTPPENGGNPFGGQMPEGFTFPEGIKPPQGGEMPEGMMPPENGVNPFGGQFSAGSAPSASSMSKTVSDSSQGNMFGGMMPPGFGEENPFGGEMPDFSQMPEGMTPPEDENGNFKMPENFSDMFGGGKGGFGGMGSSDVKLQYIDDDPDSYQNIFGNAKTDITKADKTRLIEALKKLSVGEDLENTVDIEAVIRYFAVHNFVVNSDSYTGSMIHNYYLYEKDGQMQMIPWDYNLAFGSFMSMGSATSSVNDPIDTPLSANGSGDRPMIDWIFSNEEYTELYHQILGELIENYFDGGYFSEMIDSVRSMISPYVEKDPTKFCTYEEFEAGISALKDFCLLRAESVKGQLDGTIGRTSDTQNEESLVDASEIDLRTLGSMGNIGNGPNMRNDRNSTTDEKNSDSQNPAVLQEDVPEKGSAKNRRPDGNSPNGTQIQAQSDGTPDSQSLLYIGISISVLVAGTVFALKYKRRK